MEKPIEIKLTLTNSNDLWVLYHLFTARHSELTTRRFKGLTDDDRAELETEIRRWFGYANQIREYYEDKTNYEK